MDDDCVKGTCDSLERYLRAHSSLEKVSFEMYDSCPREMMRSCLVSVICTRTIRDISLIALSEFLSMCDIRTLQFI